MRARALALLLTCCPLLAAAGDGAAAAPAKREVNAHLQMMAQLPFLTPRDALGEGVKLALVGGQAKLSLPAKDGGVTVFYAQGNVAVVPGDAAGVGNAVAIPVPKEGFSQALALDLPCTDGSTTKVALAFARGKDNSELLCRNLAVVAAQVDRHAVCVVDDNCNGKYNDAGEDAIIIDAGRLAAPLGQTVMLGNVPHKIEVAENGRKMTFTPAPAKTGLAGLVSEEAYTAVLAGAVLKGSDGSCFPLLPNTAVSLPTGGYLLAFASLTDGAGHKAVIKDGDLKVNVAEGNVPAVVKLGPPKLQLAFKVNAEARNVTLTAAGADGMKCDGGKLTYLFVPPQATIRFIDQSQTIRRIVGSLSVDMEGKEPSTTFSPNSYGMLWGNSYLAEMIWPMGIGPVLYSFVNLPLPAR